MVSDFGGREAGFILSLLISREAFETQRRAEVTAKVAE
jgi:hypothetical protein